MREDVVWTLTVCLMIGYISCSPFFRDLARYEGSDCELANGGGHGVCRKIVNCEHQLQAVHNNTYQKKDRCSFDNDIEIVCCRPVEVRNNGNGTEKKRADIACEEYENESSVGYFILGGENAKAEELPYMVALGYKSRSGEIKYTCGGTLISKKHVLTAAHCVSNRDESVPTQVRLGSIDLVNSSASVQIKDVASAMPHPEYKRSANYHDIAIITLKDEVEFRTSVRPVCLQTRFKMNLDPGKNETLNIAGWGTTSIDFTETTRLKKATGLDFVDSNECDRFYESDRQTRMKNGIDDTMICVIDRNRTRSADACWGDSGGPLLLYSGTKYTLAGVTAFGKACGSIVPSVYMSVYSYMDWIEQHVWPENATEQ